MSSQSAGQAYFAMPLAACMMFWRHDIQHNDTKHNGIQRNATEHNEIRHNDKNGTA